MKKKEAQRPSTMNLRQRDKEYQAWEQNQQIDTKKEKILVKKAPFNKKRRIKNTITNKKNQHQIRLELSKPRTPAEEP